MTLPRVSNAKQANPARAPGGDSILCERLDLQDALGQRMGIGTICLMKIVCASSVLFGQEAFSTLGEVSVIPDREIGPEHLQDAQVLVTRSKTEIGEELLKNTAVRFAGTATAGTDHMDIPYLERAGVAWCAAPGCNADSVAEYFTAALLRFSHRHGLELPGLTLGVIGVGEVGSRVAKKARILGMRVLLNDPPKQAREGRGDFVSLSALLPECDILTLHVPLIDGGRYATRQLANYLFFELLKPGALFVNASRGEVQDEDALSACLESGRVRQAILDVWENEPCFSGVLMDRVDLGTPHIAGYSYEGRLKGTLMVLEQACRFFGRECRWTGEELLPKPPPIELDVAGLSQAEALHHLVTTAYEIERDDRNLRAGSAADDPTRAALFAQLRAKYPVRHEFPRFQVRLIHAAPSFKEQVRELGFQIQA